MLHECRRVTICLDGWTAKGMASSYLGISASFFDTKSATPKHVTLNIFNLPHPHTGEAILTVLTNCLEQ
jgi:hypothetical protein